MRQIHADARPAALTVLGALILATLLAPGEAYAQCVPRSFTVDTTGDQPDLEIDGMCRAVPGSCTLRAAIQEANAAACGPTTIHFDIGGGGYRLIAIGSSPLPALAREVVIDGTSQPGAAPNTAGLLEPGNAVLQVELRGNGETPYGLYMSCPDGETRPSEIRGLVLNGFGSYAFLNSRCDGVRFAGNHVGVTADGTADGPGEAFYGVAVVDAADTEIGGTAPADRNVVAGSGVANVALLGTQDPQDEAFRTWRNAIVNNFVGTNAVGDAGIGGAAPATDFGILLAGPGVTPWVADPTPTTPHPDANGVFYNVVGGHVDAGILVAGGDGAGGSPLPAAHTFIAANIVGHGTPAADLLLGGGDGSIPSAEPSLANGGAGIRLGDAANALPSEASFVQQNAVTQSATGIDVALGGTDVAALNRVWSNTGPGIRFTSSTGLVGNEIWDNGGLGIEAAVASAEPLPWIVLEDVTESHVEGSVDLPVSLPPSSYTCVRTTLELFSNDACDPSGFGEGRERVEVVELGGCPATFVHARTQASSPRPWLAATATWTLGLSWAARPWSLPPISSDFSNCVADPLPEPGTAWLLGSGTGLLALLARRRLTPPRAGRR